MRDYLGVSELGSCSRRVVYAHTPSLEPAFTEEAQRRMKLGHLIENLRRQELREAGVEVLGEQQEVVFGPAKGHLDGYLRTPDGVLLLEVKSTSGFAISHWAQLLRHYALQCHGYMAGLSDLLGEEVSRFRIDVVDRASAELSMLNSSLTTKYADSAAALSSQQAINNIQRIPIYKGTSTCSVTTPGSCLATR